MLCKFSNSLTNACGFFFMALGLLALYISVVSLTNSTEIKVSQQELTIQHDPFPSLSKIKTIPVKEISHLFVHIIRTHGNLAGTGYSWELLWVDQFGKKRRLISAIPDWNQAQFLKQEIERFLSWVRSEKENAKNLPQENTAQLANLRKVKNEKD
jgi:hypothetical protein